MVYESEYDEFFTHLCWKYGLDPYETDGEEMEGRCLDSEFRQLVELWNETYGY